MMKRRIISILLILGSLVGVFNLFAQFGYDDSYSPDEIFEVDNLYYRRISDTEVELTYKSIPVEIVDVTDLDTEWVSVSYNCDTVAEVCDTVVEVCDTVVEDDYIDLGSGNLYENLSEITIPKKITYNGKSYSVVSIGSYAFKDCSNLRSVSIPNSVTLIEECAFYGCSNLTSITLPNSIISIGDNAFTSSGLKTASTPASLKIGQNVFPLTTKIIRR